ncbi:unnamed protein product [Schistocephalus solidus]|uniref:Kelch repeat protein n=1 Tax=Schistocephalus solidus TaxID=70667 RepID=A0A183S9J7_SCHSO|nr:unnamed protein product [Schistocephalus solidus]
MGYGFDLVGERPELALAAYGVAVAPIVGLFERRWEVRESDIPGVEAHTTPETLTWFSPLVVTVARGVTAGKNPTSRSHRWYTLPSLKEKRTDSVAVALPDGRVFVIGGFTYVNNSGTCISSVEACHLREPADWQGQHNASNFFWKNAAPMIYARSKHAAVAFDGYIFVVGGTGGYPNSIEVFSLPDDHRPIGEWTVLTKRTLTWQYISLVVWQDRLLAFGSKNQTSNLILEFVPPSSQSAPSRKKFESWTWLDLDTVDDLRCIERAFLMGQV